MDCFIIRTAEELGGARGEDGNKDTVGKPIDIPKLKRFFTKLKKMDIWEMWSDEDDISFIIRQIIVGEDGVLRVELVDGDTIDYELQEFHPRTMQVGNAEEKLTGKRGSKKKEVEKILLPGAAVKSCRNCGGDAIQMPGHREKIFCCSKCRIEWWQAHPKSVGKKQFEYKCQHCGKVFYAYGKAGRKYCGQECYQAARWGE